MFIRLISPRVLANEIMFDSVTKSNKTRRLSPLSERHSDFKSNCASCSLKKGSYCQNLRRILTKHSGLQELPFQERSARVRGHILYRGPLRRQCSCSCRMLVARRGYRRLLGATFQPKSTLVSRSSCYLLLVCFLYLYCMSVCTIYLDCQTNKINNRNFLYFIFKLFLLS